MHPAKLSQQIHNTTQHSLTHALDTPSPIAASMSTADKQTKHAPAEEKPSSKIAPAPASLSTKDVVVPLMVGMLFGSAFQLSRVHELYFVRSQMVMDKFLMLKMFLSAAATSMTVLAVMPLVSRRARGRVAAKAHSMSVAVGEARGLPAVVLGAGMLGVGMALTGSCPGTVFAQIAAGSNAARFILLGGLLGGASFPLAELLIGPAAWANLLRSGRSRVQTLTLDKVAGARSPAAVALPLAAALAAFVAVIEWAAPWQGELAALAGVAGAKGASFSSSIPLSIPPYIAGMVVGSLQVPLVMLLDKHLGCSGGYVAFCGGVVRAVCGERVCAKMPSIQMAATSAFQIWMSAGIALGAYLCSSALVSGAAAPYLSNTLPVASAMSATEGVVGGFLLVAGARLAAGCTSGHGISGFGLLSLNSVIAVASMFATGMATSFMFYR